MTRMNLWLMVIIMSVLIPETGCGSKEVKELKEVGNVMRMLADPRIPGPVYDRLRWKVEDFYTDPGAISLCKAIQAKDLTAIDRIIKSGVDVNVKGKGNMTPLLWAFPMGEEVFGHLLDLGADPNIKFTKDIWGGFDKLYNEKRIKSGRVDPLQKEVFEWLAKEGADWEAARKAIENDVYKTIKDLPADYQHRPWLPQRPTLKKPEDENNK